MKHKLITLENDLRLIVAPIPSLASATITVWVGTGSRFEAPRTSGLSHFLEHMVFKGSQKRPSAKLIAQAVDAIGGEFNAGTTKEWTNFYIKVRNQRLGLAFDVLSDMVLNPLLKKEDIEREKGVIVEEIAMCEDTPAMRIGHVFEQVIFQGTSLARDIIGTAKTVKGMKRVDFQRYRKRYYYPENIVLTVSGGIVEKDALKLAKKYFGEIKLGAKSQVGETGFQSSQKKPRFKLYPKKKEQAHFILGFLASPRGHRDRYIEAVLATILGGGMSSRLFSEIREKRGLAYAVKTGVDSYRDTGYLATYAGVDPKRIEEAVKVMLEEHSKISRSAGKNQELKKAKEYVKGHLALVLEDTKSVNEFFGIEELLLGKTRTPEQVFQAIDKVTIQDVIRVAKKLFVPEKLNLTIIGPYRASVRFERLISSFH